MSQVVHIVKKWITSISSSLLSRLDFRRLPGPVFDPPRRMSAGSFSRTAVGNRAYLPAPPFFLWDGEGRVIL